jgi:hypothetical protein
MIPINIYQLVMNDSSKKLINYKSYHLISYQNWSLNNYINNKILTSNYTLIKFQQENVKSA